MCQDCVATLAVAANPVSAPACPECRTETVTARNRLAEKLITRIPLPCRNQGGCDFSGTERERMEHEKECAFTPCGYEGCSFRDSPDRLVDHRQCCIYRTVPCLWSSACNQVRPDDMIRHLRRAHALCMHETEVGCEVWIKLLVQEDTSEEGQTWSRYFTINGDIIVLFIHIRDNVLSFIGPLSYHPHGTQSGPYMMKIEIEAQGNMSHYANVVVRQAVGTFAESIHEASTRITEDWQKCTPFLTMQVPLEYIRFKEGSNGKSLTVNLTLDQPESVTRKRTGRKRTRS